MASGPWNSKYFIEGLGIGLFTETMYRLDATNNVDLAHLDDTGEKVKSVLEILKERLPSFTPNSLKITLDGRDMSGEYILVEVMNISYIGPNLCLAPHANPSDGLLDIVFVSKDGQDNLSKCLSSLHRRQATLSGSYRPHRSASCRSNGTALPSTRMTRCGRTTPRNFRLRQTLSM